MKKSEKILKNRVMTIDELQTDTNDISVSFKVRNLNQLFLRTYLIHCESQINNTFDRSIG